MFFDDQAAEGELIPHYHGDVVRAVFIATVILSVVVIPIWGYVIPFDMTTDISTGIVLIVLAGLINPHGKIIMALSVLASAGGFFLLEWFALTHRTTDSLELLIVREVGAVLFIGALYFSVKTLRAMFQGKLGKVPALSEFDSKK